MADSYDTLSFTVSVEDPCQKELPTANAALIMADDVARDVFTQICLASPNVGLAGQYPPRTEYEVRIDGQLVDVEYALMPLRTGVFIIPETTVTTEDLNAALMGASIPSLPTLLAAQAQYQTTFRLDANPATALIVGASAVELAAHEGARQLATVVNRKLVASLIPKGSQAKISPLTVIDELLPALGTGRLCEEDPALWTKVKGLVSARNNAAHQGEITDTASPLALATAGRHCVRWIESEVQRVNAGRCS